MAAPSAPLIQDVLGVYVTGSTVNPYWSSNGSCTSSAYAFYLDGEVVASGQATMVEDSWNFRLWECSYTADVVGNYAIGATLTSAGGTSAEGSASFVVADPPSITLVPAHGATIVSLPVNVSWAIDDVNGVSAQILEVTGGNVSYYAELPVDARSATLGVSELAGIENGESYDLWLTVTNGVGLTAIEHHVVTVDWRAPDKPEVVTVTKAAVDESVTVELSAEPDTTITLWRSVDGERAMLGEGAGGSITYRDPLPPIGIEYSYDAVATYDQTGTVSEVLSVPEHIQDRAVALNFGTDAQHAVVLQYGQTLTRSATRGGELYHFADAEGDLPMFYPTAELSETGSVSAVIFGKAKAKALYNLCRQYPVGWLRDPYGMVVRARLILTEEYDTGLAHRVTIEWAATRGGE